MVHPDASSKRRRRINISSSKSSIDNDHGFRYWASGYGKNLYSGSIGRTGALKNREVRRIILTRPAVEAGENLGFLAGRSKGETWIPYLAPLYDALRDMIPKEKLEFYLENKTIEIAPLGLYARTHPGRCLCYSRRKSKHDYLANEDVFDTHGRKRAVHYYWGYFSNRPAKASEIRTQRKPSATSVT